MVVRGWIRAEETRKNGEEQTSLIGGLVNWIFCEGWVIFYFDFPLFLLTYSLFKREGNFKIKKIQNVGAFHRYEVEAVA